MSCHEFLKLKKNGHSNDSHSQQNAFPASTTMPACLIVSALSPAFLLSQSTERIAPYQDALGRIQETVYLALSQWWKMKEQGLSVSDRRLNRQPEASLTQD